MLEMINLTCSLLRRVSRSCYSLPSFSQDRVVVGVSGSGETSSAQDIEMNDYRPAVCTDYRPVVHTRPKPKHKQHARGIIYQRKQKARDKINAPGSPAKRSSALTTFIPDPPSVDPTNTSQLMLLANSAQMMAILLQQDGQWIDVREFRRDAIIEAIAQVQLSNPDQEWFLYNKDGRGIALEDCPTHEDDFIYLDTDSSGFPAVYIL
ncbi:hypothetical protein O1611_g1767 [Lasiodiplodia mahajangana]|uniref:Uncharacterized protein n=1 Tax=Lasiodiplodia mahajangana TaxID=1108764 RepID=A0ACC2JWF3_9PEZI|nr:hypothetical protein O1611_g1767 [Lasiodiplodia mahajangana]